MKKLLCIAAAATSLVLAACATVDMTSQLATLERAAVTAYRDAAAAVVLKGISKEEGAKLKREGDRLREQYKALAIIKGLPPETQAVKDARAQLLAALSGGELDGPALGGAGGAQ